MGDVQFIGDCQPGMPVDSGAGILAAIRLAGIIDSDCNYVLVSTVAKERG